MSPSNLFRLAALAAMAIATVPSIAQDNRAPEFTTAPYPIADVGHDYRYDADAVDADEDPLTFDLLDAPPDATLDAATGELLWVPDEDDIGMHPLALRVSDLHEAYAEQRAELRVLEDFCPIYPIALPRAVVEPLAHGDRIEGMERGTGPGNFSWLTWHGDVDAPRLAQSLLPPGDSYTYVGPTDPTDTLLEIGDWSQGATGSMNSSAIRTNLDALLHEDIVLPVWEDRRAQGSSFDYLVWRFAIVRLSDYRLTGNGWMSFEFRGYANCHNDPPVAHPQHVETLEDTPVAITLTGEDRDGDAITFELLRDPQHGTLSGDAPDLSYTPHADYNGDDSFLFHVYDGEFHSKPATVTIAVVPVNDPPVAYDQHVEMPEDTPVPITLTGFDIDGDLISFELLTDPAHGVLGGTPPDLVYTPNADFNGPDAFQFRTFDGELWSTAATVSITVLPVNDPPVIVTTELPDAECGLDFRHAVIATDVDAGDELQFTLVDAPAGMTIDAATGELRWDVTGHLAGEHEVIVSASDLAGAAAEQRLVVRVSACNERPLAHPGVYATEEDTSVDIELTGDDPDNDLLDYAIVSPPQDGRLGGTPPFVTYMPDAHFEGQDSFVFIASDGGLDSEPAQVTITVTGGNSPPRIITEPERRHVMQPSAGEPVPQRLSEWTFVDLDTYPNGRWGFEDDGYTAIHLDNGNGTALVSPETYANVHVEGTWRTVDGDDDFMGVLYGFQNPYQFYWMTWKQNTQWPSRRGMQLREVALPTDGSGGLPYANPQYDPPIHYENDIPWLQGVTYTYTIDYLEGITRFAVLRDGAIVDAFVTEDNTYPSGKLAVFNASQSGAYYTLSIADISAGANVYWYEVDAIDPDGDSLTYRLRDAPEGMWINPATGTIRWSTDEQDAGVYEVLVEVSDSTGLTDTQQYALTVAADGPVIISTPPRYVLAGDQFAYAMAAFDPTPGEVLAYGLRAGPLGMGIDEFTGEIRWQTKASDVGEHAATVEVVDASGLTAVQDFTVEVTDPGHNLPPHFVSTPPTSARVGQWYSYAPVVSDPDGDEVQLGFPDDVPYHMQIFDGRNITWKPTAEQVSQFEITVDARDGKGGVARQTFVISVQDFDANVPPQILSDPVVDARIGQLYRYQVSAVDANGDDLAYELDRSPSGMSIDGNGELTWSPGQGDRAIHQISLRVVDGRGGFATQAFDLEVVALDQNRPPRISGLPQQSVVVGQPYSYAPSVSDPDGDFVALSLVDGPSGLQLDTATGAVAWTPSANQVGANDIVVRADDGRGGTAYQSWSVNVVGDSGGESNDPPSFTTTPLERVLLGGEYVYVAGASDPDGDAVAFALVSAPSGMHVTGSMVRWTPIPSDVGAHTVELVASDGRGGRATQSFTVEVSDETTSENRAPTIVSTAPTQAKADRAYHYALEAFDADGDALNYALANAPSGMSIDATGRVDWIPSATGAYTASVRVDDGQAWVEQSWTISVADGSVPLTADVSVTPNPVQPGEPITITLDVDGAGGPVTVVGTIDDQPLPMQPGGSTTVIAPVDPGTHTVVVVVDDGADSIEAIESFTVGETDDAILPVVQLIAPVEGSQDEILVLTAPAPVVATVSDDNLTRWVLVLRERGSSDTTVLAEGTGNVDAATIGRVDPTLLANGQYLLGLQAWDAGGNTASDTRPVMIEGDMKLGHFSITFEDLTVPVAGIPITVSRTYDTRRRAANLDFGHGWSVDYQSIRVQESRAPGYAWDLNVYPSGPLGLVPNWCVEPALGNVVSVVLPDGEVEKFRARAQPECNQGVAILDVGIVFEPMDDTYSTLEALDDAYGRLINGSLADAGDPGRPIDPSRYRLTTPEGREFTLDQGFGIREVHEREGGNTITFTRDGILHSSGVGVIFERDAAGRIERIIAPDGTDLRYGYDDNGDLRTFTDAVENATTFAYEPRLAHYLQDIFDPNGVRVARNIYDDDGRLEKIIDADGNEIVYERDIQGRAEVVHDRNGNPTSYVYNERGDVLLETNAEGDSIERTYDAFGNQETESNDEGETRSWTYLRARVATETNGEQETTTYTYGPFNQLEVQRDGLDNPVFRNHYANTSAGGVPIYPGPLTSIIDANDNVTSFGYHPTTGELASVTDASGTTTMVHDHRGFLTAQTDALGNRTDYVNDDMGRVLTETRRRTLPGGSVEVLTSVHTYDDKGRLVATLHPDLGTTTTEYDANDRPVVECDALDRCTTTTYDARGNVERIDHPDQSFETRGYDPNGNLVSQTDRAGRTTRYAYDKANRLVETIHPDDTPADETNNPRTRNEYDRAGRLDRTIDERGKATTYGYDLAGRRTSVTDALDNITTTEYDAAGRRSAVVDPEGHRTEYVYDDGGRLLETVFVPPAGSGEAVTRVKVEYDAAGRKVADIDAMGRITRYAYDPLGRLVTVVLPDPATGANPPLVGGSSPHADTLVTTYAYDEVGNKIAQTDAEGHTTRWEYDAMGREVARILPEGQREEKRYNAAGELVEHTDFNGLTTRYTYDDAGRLATIDHPRDADVSFGYQPTGERDTAIDGRGTSTTGYDARGRVERVTDADGAIIAYEYDEAGNLTARISPSQSLVYTYDDANRMHQVVRTIDGEPPMTTTYEYDADGNRSAMETGDGIRTEYTYDSRHRLRDLVKRTAAGALMVAMTYTVDASGMRTAVEESDPVGTIRAVTWTYDGVKRLTAEAIDHRDDRNDRTTAWTYDRVGNRLTQTRTVAGVSDSTTYTYDTNDRLKSEATTGGDTPGTTNYAYDDNGNTTQRAGPTGMVDYTWNDANRLVASAGPDGTTTYVYDADGLRVRKGHMPISGTPTTTWYVQDSTYTHAQVIEQYESVGGSQRELAASFAFADDLIAQTRYETGVRSTRYVHPDGFGSTRWLTDAIFTITDSVDYDAFGVEIGRSGSTDVEYLYRSEAFDDQIGLYYLRARWMDPNAGRFTQVDEWAGNPVRPLSLNKMLYADADPVNGRDPSGYFTITEMMSTVNAAVTLTNNAISTYSFIMGDPNSEAMDGVPTIWDFVMTFAVKAAASQLPVVVDPSGSGSLAFGATEDHHVIPVYCCGHKSQQLVTLPVRDHHRIHRELNRYATLINVVGKGVDLLVYKRPTSIFRKTPLQRLGRTRAGRGAILGGLQAFYTADGSLTSGLPPIQAALLMEGPRFVGNHHSAPRCRR